MINVLKRIGKSAHMNYAKAYAVYALDFLETHGVTHTYSQCKGSGCESSTL